MRILARLGSLRMVVTVLTIISGLQLLLISIGNITDFGTNQAFVVHVLAMDTTFRSPHMMWRAIDNRTLADVAYLAIIGWECLTALVFGTGVVAWVQVFAGRRDAGVARRVSTLGWLMQAVLFGGGFIVIGGEWFQMWESSKWNGLQPALQNLIIAAAGIIIANLPSREAAAGDTNPSRHEAAGRDPLPTGEGADHVVESA